MVGLIRRLLQTAIKNATANKPKMQPKNLKNLSRQEKIDFFNSFDCVFTDCDGVLWLGPSVILGAPDVMNGLKDCNKSIYYLTNNSLKTPDQMAERFRKMGFNAIKNEILCTSLLTAAYLKLHKFTGKAYLLTSLAVKAEIDAIGIKNIGVGPDVYEPKGEDVKVEDHDLDPEVTAVIAGYDVHFSYPKLHKAVGYLSNPNCLFIATNTDERFPMPGGRLIPGAGSFVKAVETASGREPTVIGKPSTFAFELVRQKKDIQPKKVLMIGDRCNTDIQFGKATGMQTLLVLTGVHSLNDVNEFEKKEQTQYVPDYYAESIADLLEVIELGASSSPH